MGRHHHSFLDSLKDIGHKAEHAFNSQPPILKSLEESTVKGLVRGGPVGIVLALATNPIIDKAIISGIQKAAPSIESAIKTVGHEAVATVKRAEHSVVKVGGSIEGMASGALHSVEHFGGNLLGDLKYIPYVAGAIALIWVYSKVK